MKKNAQGLYVGARKLWGTRKKVSEEMVRERLREKSENAEKVDVVRVYREDERRTRWWFWLKGDESVLSDLDNVVLGEHWKVQKKSPFLGMAIYSEGTGPISRLMKKMKEHYIDFPIFNNEAKVVLILTAACRSPAIMKKIYVT